MHPHLVDVPLFFLVAIGAAAAVASLLAEKKRLPLVMVLALAAGAAAGLAAHSQPWGQRKISVQSYGTLILTGFIVGVWLAARRAPRVGIAPKHCVDLGVWGVVVGIAGARLLHIIMYWPNYTPFLDGFEPARVLKWFRIWEAGLAFHGVLFTVLPFTWLYCRRHKLPALVLLDLAVPSLIAGQAFGRVGCFLFGCCYGKTADVSWAVCFPKGAPAHWAQVQEGLIPPSAAWSAAVHPTQLYGAIGAALVAACLYSYWPRRRYDGQILALMLILASATRFFEELLRADEPPTFAAVPWLTTAHWLALLALLAGAGLMFCFKRRGTLYKAGAVSHSGETAHA